MPTHRLSIPALATIVLAMTSPIANAQERSIIRLKEIEGRTWLIDPEGNPFFAHGITHVSNKDLSDDYDAVSVACKELGFNAYGYGCPRQLKSDMPYVEGRNYVPISTYLGRTFRFIDIFDPKVQKRLADQVRQRCIENRDNPNLIGYFWTDLSAWPLNNSVGKNWVDFIRELPPDAAGQKAYAEFLKSWRGDDPKARDLAFLKVIAREYFRVMGEANREHDPDHLVFGDRFAFNTIVPEVIDEMLPWVDAIAIQPPFQPGFPKAKYQEIHEMTGKPILICDFAIRFKDGDKSIRGWRPQENAQMAGYHYTKYIHDALQTPYIIGAFWCNPIDSQPAFQKTGIKQGLFDEGLKRRPGLSEAVAELNQHIAQVTSGDSDAKWSSPSPSVPNAVDKSKTDSSRNPNASSGQLSSPRSLALLKALKLSDKQEPEFLALQKIMFKKLAEFQNLPSEQRKEVQKAFFNERYQKLVTLLTPEQLKAYREFQQTWNSTDNNEKE
ncbi:MAG: beta-agarase [Planctomycetota bacterium]